MSRYEGLGTPLRTEVLERDRYRCRWCGATNRGVDLHHIIYRRGPQEDTAGNLICLCRGCHEAVHGTNPGRPISKADAQRVLSELVETPGVTGLAILRRGQLRQAPNDIDNLGLCDGCGKMCNVSASPDGRAQFCDPCLSFLDMEYSEDD